MSELLSWGGKDIIFLALLVFNAGGLFWAMKNHLGHIQKALDEIQERLISMDNRLSHLEGVWDARRLSLT